jgi:hypothetical protein
MKTKITVAVMLFLSALSIQAQVSIGFRAGANFSNYNRSIWPDDSTKTKMFIDLHGGITVDVWIGKKMAIQTGIFYSGGGQEFSREWKYIFPYTSTSDTAVSKVSGSFRSSVLKLPLLLTFDSDGPAGMGNDDGIFDGFRVEAGLYLAYRMQSKLTTDTDYAIVAYDSLGTASETGSFRKTVTTKINTGPGQLRALDAGIQFGFGIEKSVGLGTLLLNFNFNFGLLDLNQYNQAQKPGNYKPVHYKDWGISLTYFFPSFN